MHAELHIWPARAIDQARSGNRMQAGVRWSLRTKRRLGDEGPVANDVHGHIRLFPLSEPHTLLFAALLALLLGATPLLAAAPGGTILDRFAQRMQRLAPLQSMRCRTRVTVTMGKDTRFTQVLRVSVKRPDKLRLDVISSSIPLLQGWSYVRRGNVLAAYDPISERTVSLSMDQLTDRHPMRLDTAFNLPAAMFDPRAFAMSYLGRSKAAGKVCEQVQLKPRQPLFFQGSTIRRILFQVDPKTLAPYNETAWDEKGNKVLVATFGQPVTVAPGLVANLSMDSLGKWGGRATIRFRWLGKALVPVYMRFIGPEHGEHERERWHHQPPAGKASWAVPPGRGREQHGVMEAWHSEFELDPALTDRDFALE